MAELKEKIADYEDILANESRVFDIIKSESQEIVNKFDDDRRTEISPVIGSVDDEDLIPVEESILTLTNMGYMKRMTVDTYKAQNRGGRGIMGMSRREEDVAKRCSAVPRMMLCSFSQTRARFSAKGIRNSRLIQNRQRA